MTKQKALAFAADCLDTTPVQLLLKGDVTLPPQFYPRLERYLKGEPLAYLRGFVDFLGCHISVSSDVLIPRQETEILADKIVQSAPTGILWDLCTGSGCLAIAIKKHCPDLNVFASDISPKALALAKQNATENAVSITFYEGDFLAPFAGQTADVIVSNPPYVTEEEYAALDPQVKDWEPKLALVGGDTFYRQLAQNLPECMNPGGTAWLESSPQMIAQSLSYFADWKTEVIKDYAGHDRFLVVKNG
ncbi:MAG: peptide chain release factor N(5)-glutamine methyltransferase [Chlamydiia bacterium]|nr:peptide chain release factor N(5)-glutamine methyltransferase [Chlamydiia bacterium]